MSYKKPEVVEFENLVKEDTSESGNKAIVKFFAILVDIRDALIPNNPNDKNT